MSAKAISVAWFQLGRIVGTASAVTAIPQDEILLALQRHQTGDWGEVERDDRAENERSLLEGERLVSIYRSLAGVKFYIITEANRLQTTAMLPEDY